MTAHTCPQGHSSVADDWCDVCGAPIAAGATGGAEASMGAPHTSHQSSAVVSWPSGHRRAVTA